MSGRAGRRATRVLVLAAVLAVGGLVSRTLLRRSDTQVHLLNQESAASGGRDQGKEHA